MTISATPTLQGFKDWVRLFMGVPVGALPDDSIWFDWAYEVAIAIVNPQLAAVAGPGWPIPGLSIPPAGATPLYSLAVYNLGGDNLVNWVLDDPNAAAPYKTYWADLRTSFNTAGFVPGAIESSSDENTAQSMVVPEQFKTYTMANLQQMKTPWGRYYLGVAASVGTLWGLT